MDLNLPPAIGEIVAHLPYTESRVGLSGSRVLLYEQMVLKIGPHTASAENETAMLRFLAGKLPVPRVLACVVENGTRYLLTDRFKDRMLCDESLMAHPYQVAELLADGLNQLWAVDISDCPTRSWLTRRLRVAEDNVAQGRVIPEQVEPETFGPGGFADPEALLRYLQENRPEETPTLVHGDYCLPNVLTDGSRVTGFIDLDWCGVADKWADIALAWRSLKHNCDGHHGSHPGWSSRLIFDALGIAPDWERLRYYLLLDELF